MRKAKVLGLCGFLWFAGCAGYSWEVVDKLPFGMDGRTSCKKDGKPFVEIRKGLDEVRFDVVRSHEEVHVRQIQREKSCLEASKRYRDDPLYKTNAEAEAFCKSVMPVAVNQKVAQLQIVQILAVNYFIPLPMLTIDSVVNRWCNPEIRPGL